MSYLIKNKNHSGKKFILIKERYAEVGSELFRNTNEKKLKKS